MEMLMQLAGKVTMTFWVLKNFPVPNQDKKLKVKCCIVVDFWKKFKFGG